MAAVITAVPDDQKINRVRRTKLPYLLLLPGIAWLVLFFAVPLFFQASMSLQTGTLESGYALTWHWSTYSDALSEYGPHFLRSMMYAGAATVLCLVAAYPLAY